MLRLRPAAAAAVPELIPLLKGEWEAIAVARALEATGPAAAADATLITSSALAAVQSASGRAQMRMVITPSP